MTTHTPHVSDPLTLALTHLASADDHGESAREARTVADSLGGRDCREAHSIAGRWREAERLAIKRAEVLALVAQAQALDTIADALSRIALDR